MGLAGAAAAGIGGGIIGGAFQYAANRDQIDAAGRAQDQVASSIHGQSMLNDAAVTNANERINAAGMDAASYLANGFGNAYGTIAGYGKDATGAATQGGAGAGQTLDATLADGLARMGAGAMSQQGGYAGARGSVAGGARVASDYLSRLSGGRSGAMLDRPGGLYGDFQADPGYQFSVNEGLSAIDRQFAARGGRTGGAAQKAVVDYATGRANQAYNDFAQRRTAEFGAAANNDAYNAGIGTNLANLAMGAANNDAQLQVGAGNAAFGAGQAAAGYGAGIGGQKAQQQFSLGDLLARLYTGQGAALGGLQQAQGGAMAANALNTAGAIAGNQIQGAQLNTSMIGALAGASQMPVQYAGQGLAGLGNSFSNIGNNLAFLGMMNAGNGGGGGGTGYMPPSGYRGTFDPFGGS